MRSLPRRIAFVACWIGAVCCATSAVAQVSSSQDGFNPSSNGLVWSLAVQADGKILVGGSNIRRLHEDGSIDGTFNQEVNQSVHAVKVQPDGKILIAGHFTTVNNGATSRNRIARLNSDGSLDTTFDPGAGADGLVWALALQADGKVVLGGEFTTLGGVSRNFIGRLNADGSLDTTFDPGFDNQVRALEVQPDGRLVVGGAFYFIGSITRPRIARLFADGRVDPDFDPQASGMVNALAVQPDGKIVVGGLFGSFFSGAGPTRNRIARVNPDGSVDGAFDPGANAWVHAVTLQPDGKILVGGEFTLLGGGGTGVEAHLRLGRLNADGSPDTAFAPGANNNIWALAVESSGSVLAGGQFDTFGGGLPGQYPRNGIGRVYAGGWLDLDFTPTASPVGGFVSALAVQPNGRVVVGGNFTALGGALRNRIARLTPDGYPDSFDPNANAGISAIAVQPDGKIVVGGNFTSIGGFGCTRFARLNPGGTVDSCFSAATSGDVYALALQADGKILVGGNFFAVGGEAHGGLARLNADTSVDSAFVADANSWINTIAVQPDGKILVGGAFTTLAGGMRHSIGRLNADGSLDTSFVDPSPNGAVTSIALQADGKILIGGFFTNGIRRLNADGTTDLAFIATTNGVVHAILVQADGRIVAGGDFTLITGGQRARIAQLYPDGTLEHDEDPWFFNPGANNTVGALALQADGKVVAGGTFTILGGQSHQYIGRLTNTAAATQTLRLTNGGTRITWSRGGVSQEVASVTFESSADGTTYTALGSGTRTTGGWTLNGLGLGSKTNLLIRARGFGRGGIDNGSVSIIESVLNSYFGASFTDDPLVATVTPIRAVHIQELRARIDTVRARYALAPFGYAPPANVPIVLGAFMRAADITQMRTALAEAYTAAGLSPPGYATSPASGITIVVADVAALRTALLAIE